MIVEYEEYLGLGYSKIPEPVFIPLMADAQGIVDKMTFGRVTKDTATEENKRGLCRLAELFYSKEQSEGESGMPVSSFKNGDYSENYATSALSSAKGFNSKVSQIVFRYFTTEQLYRGVCNYESLQRCDNGMEQDED